MKKNYKEFIKQVNEKKVILENARMALKEKFIGIDDVIDKIINNINLWYLTPELQFNPLIISLWGITGVGKTDLVRTLVKLLNFTDKFLEIQLDVQNYYQKNIQDCLENSSIESYDQGILLLDEIQRYRAIDESGKMIKNEYYNDMWMLLSDGKFQNNERRKRELLELLLDEFYMKDYRLYEESNEEDKSDEPVPVLANDEESDNSKKKKKRKIERKYKTSMWLAKNIKKTLDLDTPLEEIMKLSNEERIDLLQESLNEKRDINEGKSYNKLLIFISGNIDEAFYMSDNVEDSDKDADIYHEYSKKINIINIKEALKSKFKPEQIARFGNNHVIYPCLSKKNYQQIIYKKCLQYLEQVKIEHEIEISLAPEIYDVIYRNGVFPTQGVRPVLSSISSILGSNLPFFLFTAIENKVNKIKIEFNDKTVEFFTKISDKIFSRKINLDLDILRKNKGKSEKTLILVHELGHALVYTLLFNCAPKQININAIGFSEGFVIPGTCGMNKEQIENYITVALAGRVAEEIIFGENSVSNGARTDLRSATEIAAMYIRNLGMNKFNSYIMHPIKTDHANLNFSTNESDKLIEKLITKQKKKTRTLLQDNNKIFKELLNHTQDKETITISDFISICNLNGLRLIQKEDDEIIFDDYENKLKKFLL